LQLALGLIRLLYPLTLLRITLEVVALREQLVMTVGAAEPVSALAQVAQGLGVA
jgi:hypothetical protein